MLKLNSLSQLFGFLYLWFYALNSFEKNRSLFCFQSLQFMWTFRNTQWFCSFHWVLSEAKSTLENLRILEKKRLLRLVYNSKSIWLQLSEFFSFFVFLGKSIFLACVLCFLILGHVIIPRKTFLSIVVLYPTSTFPIMHLIYPPPPHPLPPNFA